MNIDMLVWVCQMTERPELRVLTRRQKVVRLAVSSMVASSAKRHNGDNVIEYYTDAYTCCPPPLFIVIISAIQVFVCLSVCLSGSSQLL